ncbi:hypothetical protein IAQ61_003959, partial [Plenodomus lingam]|uniref:Predicted protein n=1 Tax=Leptosphaeria maculans (strain JN3 / isolate v23.1.3 / race Av1-4-5-6-7-8) TaxID=985895 RepID=E4ZQT3_LEPMJ
MGEYSRKSRPLPDQDKDMDPRNKTCGNPEGRGARANTGFLTFAYIFYHPIFEFEGNHGRGLGRRVFVGNTIHMFTGFQKAWDKQKEKKIQ